ncbi:FlgO family outer membrane protein [Aestuariibacter salexigens]|uniref:FlgO family outer membrane protein n=1 Tax=Aestuariibacter salexigens TaxID=226010 RepID=UPI00040F7D6B|nr:FlgO family outer membrane protein [Aestuariibacter salexigens]
MKSFKSTCCVVSLLLLAGCSSVYNTDTQQQFNESQLNPLGNVEYYTHQLANELFMGMHPAAQARYAVVDFVPVDALEHNLDEQHPLMLLGHQLEQGLITEATRRGFTAQDFNVSRDIIIGSEGNRVYSRNIEHLSDQQGADFYISGTITPQYRGAIVNARIINARSRDVVAAATRFFPDELFWQREKVGHRNGKLYRSDTE